VYLIALPRFLIDASDEILAAKSSNSPGKVYICLGSTLASARLDRVARIKKMTEIILASEIYHTQTSAFY
jgi:hypothetical protein